MASSVSSSLVCWRFLWFDRCWISRLLLPCKRSHILLMLVFSRASAFLLLQKRNLLFEMLVFVFEFEVLNFPAFWSCLHGGYQAAFPWHQARLFFLRVPWISWCVYPTLQCFWLWSRSISQVRHSVILWNIFNRSNLVRCSGSSIPNPNNTFRISSISFSFFLFSSVSSCSRNSGLSVYHINLT